MTSLSKDKDSTTPAFLPPTPQSKHKDSTTLASLPPTTQSKDEGSTTTKSDICPPQADESTDSAAAGIYDKLHNLQFPASGLTRKFKHEALDLSNRLFSKKPFVDPATKTRNAVTLDHTECLKKYQWLILGRHGGYCIYCKLFCKASNAPRMAGELTAQPFTTYSRKQLLQNHSKNQLSSLMC